MICPEIMKHNCMPALGAHVFLIAMKQEIGLEFANNSGFSFLYIGITRAVDNAFTLFRVWPIKNVGAMFGHASAAAYTQRTGSG